MDKLPRARKPRSDEKAKMEELVQKVRDLGRYPKSGARCSLAERQLAERIRRARKANQFSPEQEVELQALRHALLKQEEELVQQVRDLGYYPKASKRCLAERRLAARIRKARKGKQLSPEQEAELQALQQESRDARAQDLSLIHI